MMKRRLMLLILGAMVLVVPASPAAATHTGCEHARTQQAHRSVPMRNQGTEKAHHSIPYCPPEDAPRHRHQH